MRIHVHPYSVGAGMGGWGGVVRASATFGSVLPKKQKLIPVMHTLKIKWSNNYWLLIRIQECKQAVIPPNMYMKNEADRCDPHPKLNPKLCRTEGCRFEQTYVLGFRQKKSNIRELMFKEEVIIE